MQNPGPKVRVAKTAVPFRSSELKATTFLTNVVRGPGLEISSSGYPASPETNSVAI